MIKIEIDSIEVYNESTNTIEIYPKRVFSFEHSLKAISKWEQRWNIPFLSNVEKLTPEQSFDYFCCMCLDDSFQSSYLTDDTVKILNEYITRKATATTINQPKSDSKQILTSELIYAYMALAHMPFDVCEVWHIERLMKALSCISILQNPNGNSKPKSRKELIDDYRKLNAQRLSEYKTKG